MNDAGEPVPPVRCAEIDSEESRLQSIVEQFLTKVSAGEDPDPSDYILDNPSVAAKLERRLEVVRLLQSAAANDRTQPSPVTGPSYVPEVIGRYRIDGLLGSGASSTVYRAYDPKFQRWVALKVFKGFGPVGSDAPDRFERDARIAARLRHPNIVPLHDAGEHGDLRYIDMELIPGETLESRVRRNEGPWDPRAGAEIVYKLAAALDYAHRAGIVHRDVKPSNVLMDERGEPQLTDFGSARLGTDQTLTADGQIIGTPIYMPPEQAEGIGHRADPRSDVYSLGVILYRLLTGRLPFEHTGSMAALLGRIISELPPKPRAINPRIPRDLETICLKAMEKRPDDRFTTAAALADELKRWLDGEPLSIRPPNAIERLRRWSRLQRPLARVLTAFVVVLLLTVGAFGWAIWDQREQRHGAELREAEHRERARAAGELERLENERRIDLEAWSLLVRARKRVAIPTAGRRDEVVDLLRESAKLRRRLPAGEAAERLDLETRSIFAASLGVPELRTEACRTPLPRVFTAAWRAAIHPDGNSMVVGTHLGPIRWTRGQPFAVPDGLDEKKPRPRLAYHPDGVFLAIASGDGGLQIWDETASRKLADLDPSTGIEFLDFVFTEKGIRACRADGTILSWALPGWAGSVERKLDTGTVTAARFNDDASLVAVGTSDGTVHWCRTDEGKSLRQMATGRFGIDALAWSPDSYHIAVGTRNGDVQIWTRDGQLRREIPTTESGVGALHFHRNGQWLITGGRAGMMYVWNAHTGEPLLTGTDIPWCFSRDGTRLAGGNAEGVSFLELTGPTSVKRLTGHRSFIEQSAWSRDGRFLATLDRQFELRVWDVEKGISPARFTVEPSPYAISNAALALSADGSYAAYANSGEKAALEIFDVAKGERIASHPLSDGFGRLGHDGTRFVFVREERSGKALRTVACSFAPGDSALDWHELRPLVPDEVMFHTSVMTSDGRYYMWAGPRTPAARMRVEVYDVAARKRLRRIDCPHEAVLQSWGSALSADGRLIWIADRIPGYMRHDVFGNEPPTHVPFTEHASPNRKWFAAADFADARLGKIPIQQLRNRPDGPARFQFTNGDLDGMGTASFSPDSRYVSWVGPGHHITVVELPALSLKVQEFERSLAE